MLKHQSVIRIKNLLTCSILIASFFLSNSSRAQHTSPLKSGSTIQLTFDENGKMLSAPAGFSLQEHSPYTFKVTVTAPEKQHAKLKKYFRESLLSLKEKLDDPSNMEAQLCSLLLGSDPEVDKYKKELGDLAAIIAQADSLAEETLKKKIRNNEYTYLPSAQVLLDCLYGKIFTVTANGQSITDRYDRDIEIKIPADNYPANQTSLPVQVADLKKQFVADYFNKTYTEIQATIDALAPGVFYRKDAETGITELISSRQRLIDTLSKLKPSNLGVICDFSAFESQYSRNKFISLLASYPKWFLSWAWYTEGEIRLNPLNFTDLSRLRLQEGFDKSRADSLDKYIKISMERMTNLKSDLKISIAEFDSLNKNSDKGRERYSYAAANEELKKKNKLALTKSQQINRTIDSLSFRVIAKDDRKPYFLKTYDAANRLQPAAKSKKQALSLAKEVEIMVYNIKATESVTVTPEFKDTPDESMAMQQLKQVGTLGTSLMEQAAIAGPIFASLNKALSPSAPVTVLLDLPPIKQTVVKKGPGLSVGEKLLGEDEKQLYQIMLVVDKKSGALRLVFSSAKRQDEYDFWAEVVEALIEKKVNCDEVLTRVKKKLFDSLKSENAEDTFTASEYRTARDMEVKKQRDAIRALLEEAINEYIAEVQNRLEDDFPLLTLAQVMLKSNAYILPPKALNTEDDPAAPAYSNIYESVALQESSKRVTIPLVLTNKADGKVIAKRTDSYKVSQPHWLMASMGISYALGEFRRNEVEVKEGKIINAPDEEQARLLTGLHIYPNPILLTDNRFIGSMRRGWEWTSRLSIFVGASFPKPLYNPQFGISVDPWPGVKATYGVHFYRKNSQTIVNDQIQKETTGYVYNSPFLSLSIEPVSFVKLIGLIK